MQGEKLHAGGMRLTMDPSGHVLTSNGQTELGQAGKLQAGGTLTNVLPSGHGATSEGHAIFGQS